MGTLNDDVMKYTEELKSGYIQRAYRGIMAFMSEFKAYMEGKYPDYISSAVYFGYMDMTYFALTPPALRSLKLKTALVYLHEERRFELWLAANNRKIQEEYIDNLSKKDLMGYKLSKVSPGVDSIIEDIIVNNPDFDKKEELIKLIENKIDKFINDVLTIII